jgi:hypothetical protein
MFSSKIMTALYLSLLTSISPVTLSASDNRNNTWQMSPDAKALCAVTGAVVLFGGFLYLALTTNNQKNLIIHGGIEISRDLIRSGDIDPANILKILPPGYNTVTVNGGIKIT